MNTKKVIAAVVLSLFTVPAFASAYTYNSSDYPGATETLVEGHTVFSTIDACFLMENMGSYGTDANNTTYDNEIARPCNNRENQSDFDVSWDVRANVTVQRLGTAVAVLVRDRIKPYYPAPSPMECYNNRDVVATVLYENPGVLWFNDQFLVGDDLDIIEARVDANVDVCEKNVNVIIDVDQEPWRYPCGGWVFATQAGNPDPRLSLASFNYVESYQIIDPNDNLWVIDKYGVYGAVGSDVPAVDQMVDLGMDEDAPGFDGDDAADGDLRAVVAESADGTGSLGFYLGIVDLWSVPVMMLDVVDPGPSSGCSYTPYTEASIPTTGQTAAYNAVLFFFFEDLVLQGGTIPVNTGAPKIHGDGAPDSTDTNGCEEAHRTWEQPEDWACPGHNEAREGNSHAFNPSGTQGPIHIHPTAAVDLYFSNVQPAVPASRTYAVFDTVGSGAPMHDHPAGVLFDDRVYADACLDVDSFYANQDYVYNGGGTWTGNYTEEESEDFRGGVTSDPVSTEGDGEAAPGDGANSDDCTGGYQGGSTGWHPSGEGSDGSSVPTSEYY